jgi:DNA-binding CsgD family transcriptional regulator
MHLDAGGLFHLSSSGFSPAYLAAYRTVGVRIERKYFEKMKLLGPSRPMVAHREFGSIEEFNDSPMIRLGARFSNQYDRAGVALSDLPGVIDVALISFTREHGLIRDAEVDSWMAYVHHMRRAMSLARPVSRLRQEYGAALSVLDALLVAVFVLDCQRRVVLSNEEAQRLLDSGSGLLLDGVGRLAPEDDSRTGEFVGAVDDACDPAAATDVSERALLLRSHDGKGSTVVLVCPLVERTGEFSASFQGAVVFGVDQEVARQIRVGRLSAAFGLTTAEENVASMVVQGASNPEIARVRDVSPETIKTQVAALLRKTGSAGRLDLLRKALSLAWPVRPSEPRSLVDRVVRRVKRSAGL